jgi:predicted AlkP superfamily phosphohydrolase/phosphomutase
MINRRKFIKQMTALGVASAFYPLSRSESKQPVRGLKMLVLGIDGMDPHLAHAYMRKGLLPNFARLSRTGCFKTVSSSFPPQSPVAWSDFSIGATSRIHGIYDFIHRQPETITPFDSTSVITGASKTFRLGDWIVPMNEGRVEHLRKGRPFWEYLADADIPTTVIKMPANFPCRHSRIRMISGLGTPDLRGAYGESTLFTSSKRYRDDPIHGRQIVALRFTDNTATGRLRGPKNSLHVEIPDTFIPIRIWRDPQNHTARIVIQGHEFILKQGDWTDWVTLTFSLIPYFAEVKGICKLYLKEVHPDFSLYVSPINVDSADPIWPIISPDQYTDELRKNIGRFYTQGLPADTKALSTGILTDREFLDQDEQVFLERESMLEYEMRRLESLDHGFLFFYFSNLDQSTHMFWRTVDTRHPLFDERLSKQMGQTLSHKYMQMDRVLGKVMERLDINDPAVRLIVMSDHGFAPFRRQVNINTWLRTNGYIQLKKNYVNTPPSLFQDVDWTQTAAYGIGLNALYINQAGREIQGIVPQGQSGGLLARIARELLDLKDPETGLSVVSRTKKIPEAEKNVNPFAPDLIIGWNRGYRTAWESVLGKFSETAIRDNNDKWSGDHCIDPSLVPAVFFSNRSVQKGKPALHDITATILAEFGLPLPDQFEGKALKPI